MKKAKRIVVLGAGFGGLVAAVRLAKKLGDDGEVVLVDRNEEHLYTPWLYDVATSFLINPKKQQIETLEKVSAVPVEKLIKLHGFKNLRFRKAEVVGVDPETKHVSLEGGKTLSYDYLIVGLGAKTTYYGIEGMEEYSMPMKTLENGMDVQVEIEEILKLALKEGNGQKNLVIVGAGATGSETAAELMNFLRLCDRRGLNACHLVNVMLIDASPKILGQFDPFVSKIGTERLNKLGVEMRTDTTVSKVDKKMIHTKSGMIPYDLLIWAGGIEPTKTTKTFPFEKDKRGRVIARKTLQSKKYENVFVVGDCSAFYIDKEGHALPPAAWVAIDGGLVAANNILALVNEGKVAEYSPMKKWPAIITVGGRYAVGTVFGIKISGKLAFILRRLVDLRYFMKILPFIEAVKFWFKGSYILMKND